MRKKRAFWICILLVMILLPSTLPGLLTVKAAATNSQGLEYSIDPGSVFTYNFTMNPSSQSSIPSGEYQVTINITALPTLPDHIDNLTSVQNFRLLFDTHYQMFFDNGSLVPYGYYGYMLLPTGNWSAIRELWETELYYSPLHITWIDTDDYWGFVIEQLESDISQRFACVFSKENGLLLYSFALVNRYGEVSIYDEVVLSTFEMPSNLLDVGDTEPSSEGLVWAISRGDTFQYTYYVEKNSVIEIDNVRLDVRVDFLLPIPDHLTAIHNVWLRRSQFVMYFENGSVLKSLEIPVIWTASPIGSVNLLKEKVESSFYGEVNRIDWLDSFSSWGFKLVEGVGQTRSEHTFLFSKTDGALDRGLYEMYENGDRTKRIDLKRLGFDQPNSIVVIAGGFGILAAVALVVYLMKKH